MPRAHAVHRLRRRADAQQLSVAGDRVFWRDLRAGLPSFLEAYHRRFSSINAPLSAVIHPRTVTLHRFEKEMPLAVGFFFSATLVLVKLSSVLQISATVFTGTHFSKRSFHQRAIK